MRFLYHVIFYDDSDYKIKNIHIIEAKDKEEFYQKLINDPFKYKLCEKNGNENLIYFGNIESYFRASYTKLSEEELINLFKKTLHPSDLEWAIYQKEPEYTVFYKIKQLID